MLRLHRTAGDELPGLRARVESDAAARGKAPRADPYAMLGVDIGRGNRPFCDVLLREIDAA